MEKRDQLYKEALELLTSNNPQKQSILYHNIYSLKMSDNYLFSSKQDVVELVNFLNTME